jgi:hypothetical protein
MAFPGGSTRIRALSIIVRRGTRIGGEPALLEPYARVPIVIDRQDATHGYPLDVDSAVGGPRQKRDSLSLNRAAVFALRISTLRQLCRKSPSCLPSTVHSPSPRPAAISPGNFT